MSAKAIILEMRKGKFYPEQRLFYWLVNKFKYHYFDIYPNIELFLISSPDQDDIT